MAVERFRGTSVMEAIQVGEKADTRVVEIRRYKRTINPPSVAANSVVTQNYTMNGVQSGDVVIGVHPPSALGMALGSIRATANRVTVEYINTTGVAVDLASGEWTFVVMRFAD